MDGGHFFVRLHSAPLVEVPVALEACCQKFRTRTVAPVYNAGQTLPTWSAELETRGDAVETDEQECFDTRSWYIYHVPWGVRSGHPPCIHDLLHEEKALKQR